MHIIRKLITLKDVKDIIICSRERIKDLTKNCTSSEKRLYLGYFIMRLAQKSWFIYVFLIYKYIVLWLDNRVRTLFKIANVDQRCFNFVCFNLSIIFTTWLIKWISNANIKMCLNVNLIQCYLSLIFYFKIIDN